MKARLADGASATTINRSLEVVRTILNRAARSYRDADGRPWLEALPYIDANDGLYREIEATTIGNAAILCRCQFSQLRK